MVCGCGFRQSGYRVLECLLPPNNHTIFFQGIPGMNYLISITNGSNLARDRMVLVKVQLVISFSKKEMRGLNIPGGDGFPKRFFFNGIECELPKHFHKKSLGMRLVLNVRFRLRS